MSCARVDSERGRKHQARVGRSVWNNGHAIQRSAQRGLRLLGQKLSTAAKTSSRGHDLVDRYVCKRARTARSKDERNQRVPRKNTGIGTAWPGIRQGWLP